MGTIAELSITTERLRPILARINELHPLPGHIARLLQLIEQPAPSYQSLVDFLPLDTSLIEAILLAAGQDPTPGKVNTATLSTAVLELGLSQLQAVVLSGAFTDMLKEPLGGYQLRDSELLKHSTSTACMARWLAKALSYPEPEEAYVAGLLHDIGKLVLDPFIANVHDEITDLMWKSKRYLWEAEEQLCGIDHAGVGSLMGAYWGMPGALVEAICCHHVPSLSANQPGLAAIVNVANAFSPRETLGLAELSIRMVHPDTLQILDLSIPALKHLGAKMVKEAEEFKILV